MLAEKVAVVTGAGHPEGIGFSIAKTFSQQGAKVIVLDLASVIEEYADSLGANSLETFTCDVTSEADVSSVIDSIVATYGKLDIAVNNAGLATGSGDFLATSASDWQRSFSVNLIGVVNVCRQTIPHLLQQQGSSIINIASLAGLGATEGIPAAYTASKFAVIGLTKQLAQQYAGDHLRINAICPGSIVTPMHHNTLDLLAELHQITIEEAQALENENIPLGYSAQPVEVANAALYLASSLSNYVTGIVLPVAGGMSSGL